MNVTRGRVVVIGASAGGVPALLQLAGQLAPRFPAPLCIVQHVGTHPSLLPDLLRARGPNPAVHAHEGQRLEPGTLHIAPPDHHIVLDGETIRLTRGPKENHTRPAIDPLFRSAALSWGSRAIGVVLTGQLDDGTVGLRAIKSRGGLAVVQDPGTAEWPDMPSSALRHVDVDHCVPLEAIPALLLDLVGQAPMAAELPVNERLAREAAINQGNLFMETLSTIAEPSSLTCPDCSGTLWEVKDDRPLRYRCHTGHAFTSASLELAQLDAGELALRSSVRALRERELLLRRLANIAQAAGDLLQAAAGHEQADRVRRQVVDLIAMTESRSGQSQPWPA